MVVTTYGCIKNNASRRAFLYHVNNKRLGLHVLLTQVAQDVFNTEVAQDVPVKYARQHYIMEEVLGAKKCFNVNFFSSE